MRARLDVLVTRRGLAETRSRAQSFIRAGQVLVNGQVVDKPGTQIDDKAEISLRAGRQYVSRAGAKLAAALDHFDIDPAGWSCLDVGASTGGFTDVLLQRGARSVFAVDVGHGQLAWSLRNDPRVTVMERTDIRDVQSLPAPVRLATIDVAFISLRLVLPRVRELLSNSGLAIALIKPQFEAGREQVPRGGVVANQDIHREVLKRVLTFAASSGWRVEGAVPSPIKGSSGNQEHLALLAKSDSAIGEVAAARSISRAIASVMGSMEKASGPNGPDT